MKSLTTLIKLNKRTLDTLRRRMVDLEGQKVKLQMASKTLQEELEKEMKLAAQQTEMAAFFGGFAKRIQQMQEQIALQIKALDKQMDALRGEIAVAFSDLKKFEIAKANAEKRAVKEQDRKDTIALDDIGGQQHVRKKNADA